MLPPRQSALGFGMARGDIVLGAAVAEDRALLEGPHSRRRELWLVLRAVRDFIKGFRALHFVGPCVTVFGSARFTEDHPFYGVGRDQGVTKPDDEGECLIVILGPGEKNRRQNPGIDGMAPSGAP